MSRAFGAADWTSPGCGKPALETGRPLERRLLSSGGERVFLLDAPDTLTPGKPVPLLFDFHGFGHSARGVWRVSAFREIAGREAFLTVYPEGETVTLRGRTGRGWEIFSAEGNRDLEFVARMAEFLEREYCIDRRRMYATGFSNGGFFSLLLACTMADRIAAVAPVGAALPPVACRPARAVPVLFHHGWDDEVVPVALARKARDHWVRHNGCGRPEAKNGCEFYAGCRNGAEVGYCEGEFGHHWPLPATRRIWEFFRRQKLPDTAVPNREGASTR